MNALGPMVPQQPADRQDPNLNIQENASKLEIKHDKNEEMYIQD